MTDMVVRSLPCSASPLGPNSSLPTMPCTYSPVQEILGLLQQEPSDPVQLQRLLGNAVVSHKEAVYMCNEPTHMIGCQGEHGCCCSCSQCYTHNAPCAGKEAHYPPGQQSDRCEGRQLGPGDQALLQCSALLRRPCPCAVSHHAEWQAQEMVEPMAQGVVAVVGG